jgi:hypothetical protein
MRYLFLEELIAPWRNILKRPLDRSAEGASAADLGYFATERYFIYIIIELPSWLARFAAPDRYV